MGFELPNGKTARNIQEQVAFLTEKVKELFAAVSDLGFKVVKVDVLPEEGASRTIYLVPSSDPETANMYDEYIWTEDGWEKIGSTDIDLSNYVDLTSNQTIGGNKSFSGVASFIGGANFNGPIKTSFYPETANSYDLGLSDYTWRNLYLSGDITTSADFNLTQGKGFRVGGTKRVWFYSDSVKFAVNLTAINDNTNDLGTSDVKWKDLYLAGAFYHANYNITWSNGILVKNTSNTTLFYIGSDRSVWTYGTIIPSPNSDLGNTTHVLGTVFTANISDATNSATVADIAALITYAKAQGWIA